MPRYKKSNATVKRRVDTSRKYRLTGRYEWQDPFPEVKGTAPEKRVYAMLSLMQIPFYFQSMFTVNIPEIALVKDYRPDFILPDAKVIIEVQGSYFHSKPEAIESDSYKYALYTAMGYRVLIWWDYEIETNLDGLFSRDLGTWTYRRGARIIDPAKQNYTDDLVGLRKANASKRKPYRTFIGTSKKSIRKVKSSYGTR